MSLLSLLVIGTTVIVAAFVQSTIGVGFALIAVPIIALISPQELPVLVLLLMIPLNLYVMWRERGALDWRGTGWISSGRIVGTFLGMAILALFVQWQLDLFVGLSIIAATLASTGSFSFRLTPANFIGAGLVTGITETSTGIGGPPLALLYQRHSGPVVRATIAACFLIGEVFTVAMMLIAGTARPEQLAIAGIFIPALVLGSIISHFTYKSMDGARLRRFVLGFAMVSGVVLVLRAIA